MALRKQIIRYAFEHPDTRSVLLPIIEEYDRVCERSLIRYALREVPKTKRASALENPKAWSRPLSSLLRQVPSDVRNEMKSAFSSVKKVQDFGQVSKKLEGTRQRLAQSLKETLPSWVISGFNRVVSALNPQKIANILAQGWDTLKRWGEKILSTFGFGNTDKTANNATLNFFLAYGFVCLIIILLKSATFLGIAFGVAVVVALGLKGVETYLLNQEIVKERFLPY